MFPGVRLLLRIGEIADPLTVPNRIALPQELAATFLRRRKCGFIWAPHQRLW
jgi:hypothetical protein